MSLLTPTNKKRAVFFVACDYIVFALALYGAFLVRFDGHVSGRYWAAISTFLLLELVPKFGANVGFRLYNLTWRFVGTRDVVNVFLATLVGSMAFGMLVFFVHDPLHLPGLPRSVLLIDFMLTLIGVGGVRMGKRVFQVLTVRGRVDAGAQRVLVVGAGAAGERLLRELTLPHRRYRPVGIIDDDPVKQGTYLHGVRVVGGREAMAAVIRDERVAEVIVSMPSAAGKVIREVVVAARTAGAPSVRILPGVEDVLKGRVTLAQIRDVNVEDLLGREPVELDVAAIGPSLYGRTILITGAAGSIGSELAAQIAGFEPGRLVLVEKDETRLFTLDLDLRREFHRVPVFPVVADVRDRARMRYLFGTFRPQSVFHAAAYKHVPMMEAHPQEAVLTNVFGTKVVAESAAESGTETFVLISTDKAVNPASVMGATKRVAEMIVRRCSETSGTRFVAVRFGNVLGSRGSLVTVLEEQIRRGGPITITDPDMERYFMTVTEAVRLILKAASLGDSGAVFTLDMGDPIRVVDLVEALIRLSGLEPDVDVPIQFTGARPGEKLKEELELAEEGVVATSDEKIFVAQLGREPDPAALTRGIELLGEAAAEGDPARIRSLLAETVPTYRPAPGAGGDEAFAELLESTGGPDNPDLRE